jgi:hypothetical protein
MKRTFGLLLVVAGLVVVWTAVAPTISMAQEKPVVQIPKPGVPEIMTMVG